MVQLLTVTSSPVGNYSKSSSLVKRFVDVWRHQSPGTNVSERNLGDTPPPHVDGTMVSAYYTADDERSDAHRQAIALSDSLVDELLAADIIVIGSPMHNFGISSSLKTWIDHIARVGRTFRYTEAGPEGLLKGKRVFVITASGGNYAKDHPAHAMDHQTPYLQTVLGFLGVTDVTFVHAFGIAAGEDGIRKAESEIDRIVAAAFDERAA